MLERKSIATCTWPLVVRELRVESRRPVIYWLRLLTAAVAVSVLAAFIATTELDQSEMGAALFHVLACTVIVAIWIIVPMMTADCISREKREGTLPLLFLTHLTLLDVIIGKAASHMLRAITLLLASAPILILPFMLGGIDWHDAVMALAMSFNTLLLAMAAGLFASTKGGSAIRVMVMSEIYAASLACVLFAVNQISEAVLPFAWSVIVLLVYTLILFVVILHVSVSILSETRDETGEGQPGWVDLFSGSEFWQTLFQWKHHRTLDRNPMAWLQEYSWTARLTKWGWFFSMLCAELFAFVALPAWQPQLIIILSLGVAFSATNSFRRERETGLLEALLVTPLTVGQLIWGRLWGIFCHFFPALAITAFASYEGKLLNHSEYLHNPFALITPNPAAFGALMVVGLYLSLWRLNFFLAWLLTWTVAFLIPSAATIQCARWPWISSSRIIVITSIFQLVLALVCWFLMHRNIEQRRFIHKVILV